MKKILTAVVLAGGRGSRFWPLSTDKILFPFMGQAFIQHSVLSVLPEAVNRLVLVVNETNRRELSQMPVSLPTQIVVQKNAQGMADALLSAKSALTGTSVLIMFGDDLIDRSVFTEVLATAAATNAFGVIPGVKVNSLQPLGYLRLTANRITEIVEKPAGGSEPSDYVNISGHYFEDADILLSELAKSSSQSDDHYEIAVSKIAGSQQIVMSEVRVKFSSLKYPWHVLDITDRLLQTHRASSYISKDVVLKKNVFIEGPVYIESGVKIYENSKIIGPVYIGKNSIIGNNNLIRESHIGPDCVSGFNTEIVRSYIGNSCWFHSNYIGDSVLEGNVSLGAGAICANLRLDEAEILSRINGEPTRSTRTKFGAIIGKHVRIGVNASVMPGIKIGSNSFVGSGVILSVDIPDGKYCTMKTEYSIRENTKSAEYADRKQFRKRL